MLRYTITTKSCSKQQQQQQQQQQQYHSQQQQQQFWDPAPAQQHLHYSQPVSNHAAFDLDYGYGGASNSLGLKDDSGLAIGLDGHLELAEHTSGEGRPSDALDGLALIENLPFQAASSADNDSYEDSTDSDLPPEKKKLSAAFRPRGRKKRNKCTPEQLRSLEAFFEKNRNPTGRIRLELSRKLRMPERSVQVWFQNRRAKVKTIERRGDAGSDSGRKKSYSLRTDDKSAYRGGGSGMSSRSSRDAGDPTPSVTAIPTSALCIGTWRRVSPLICFFSRRLQSLTWYLTSESIGFKLEVPWTSIRSAHFDGPLSPSIAERAEGVRVPLGRFVIDLERPPTFFMEVFRSAPAKGGMGEEPKVSWRQCEDFTEDHQAMTVSRHILNGPYEELRSAVQALARCNEVLERRIMFRDAERRAAGDIPTGSGSTADNFGLIQPLGMRAMDPLTPPIDGSAAFGGTDAYGNVVPMPMHAAGMGGVASPLPKTAAWQHFRTPRAGAEAWEFDSPASVSTNLSEASLDSTGRQLLGYSPYGVSSSIEASPRSGLGSSVDLGTLRIDTGSYAGLAPPAIAMGDGNMEGGQRTSFDWDNRMAYGLPPMHAGPSYVGESCMAGQSAPAPAPALDAPFALDALAPFSSHPGSHDYAAPAERSETSQHDLRRDSEPTALRAGRLAAFDEDAFCGQTPTQRTSFDRDNDAAGASDDEAAGGRARSNTYRPNMARTGPAPAEDASHESSDLDADGEAA